jgi:thioredoxin 1
MSQERDVHAPMTLNRADFMELVRVTNKPIIMKFGATWCGPCRRIEKQVHDGFENNRTRAVCINIDIDESIDLYAFLKGKRMINGVPALLAYRVGNGGFAPDLSVTGADINEVNAFFSSCASL